MRDRTVLPATTMCIPKWNSHAYVYSTATENHCTLVGTHFLSHWGWVGLSSSARPYSAWQNNGADSLYSYRVPFSAPTLLVVWQWLQKTTTVISKASFADSVQHWVTLARRLVKQKLNVVRGLLFITQHDMACNTILYAAYSRLWQRE